jgi:hypothetical protein
MVFLLAAEAVAPTAEHIKIAVAAGFSFGVGLHGIMALV